MESTSTPLNMHDASTGDTGSIPECKFLQLPGELRNMIYAHVFTTNDGYMFLSSFLSGCHREGLDALRPYLCEVPGKGLLQTCKQVHGEAKLLPFMLNEFSLHGLANLHASRAYFTLEQRRAITRVDLGDGSLASFVTFQMIKGESKARPRIIDVFPNVKHVTIGWREEDMVANNGRVPRWMELGEGVVLERGRYCNLTGI